MISAISCTKCTGQVIEREGLDGYEKGGLNCGFGQVQNIIPTAELAEDAKDYSLRNRGRIVLTRQSLLGRKDNHKGRLWDKAWVGKQINS